MIVTGFAVIFGLFLVEDPDSKVKYPPFREREEISEHAG